MSKKLTTKEEVKTELALLKSKDLAPDWMTWMSYGMLKGSYLQTNQNPRQRFELIAKTAASYMPKDNNEWELKFFNLIWKNHLALSTPIMGNLGTDRGLAVSCSASYVGDSMYDISYTDHEISMLSKYGFGTAINLDVRAGFEQISGGGYTNSVIDWIEKYWYTQNKVSQSNLRRGSTAIYLNFWHKELLDVLPMLESHDKLHLGILCDDSVKDALINGEENAWVRYKTILTWRSRKGKPYIIFTDNAKRQDPPQYAELGLSTNQSNLCTEIFQHTDSDHTLACVLSSMVVNRYDEWKDSDAVFNSIVFLDCVNEDLLVRGLELKGIDRVLRSAKKSRALGLGALGFHTYLQQKMIPIDSYQATRENADIFSYIKSEAERASKYLAKELGECEWTKGTGMRNTHLLAIAPNTSSALIAGSVSQGIEPMAANCYQQKLANIGSIERVNPVLIKLLKEKNKYTNEVIDHIAFNEGSVQALEFLSDEEKRVFRTAYEINQKVLIDLAEQRQKWICQGQSLNLFFSANETEEWIHAVHKHAFEKDLLKSLYYVRTMPGIRADTDDSCKACEG